MRRQQSALPGWGVRGEDVSALWLDALYGPLARELYRRCGLVFEGGQAQLFRKRIGLRAAELGWCGPEAYLADLGKRQDEAEYERLVELLTVNETYFFREVDHFHLLLDELWPQWIRQGHAVVRIWSAACSNGCEPYTLAILLRDKGLVGPGRPGVEILGTDVNARVLEEAGRGTYGEFALRGASPYFRERYFSKAGRVYHLDPDVREMVTFRRQNLLRLDDGVGLCGFHAVFCRNVLIYFDLCAKRRVVRNLTEALRPGGVLFVGRSESLFNVPEAPPQINVGGVLAYRAT